MRRRTIVYRYGDRWGAGVETIAVKVVPAFDPTCERWYVEEPKGIRVTARSLAELKFKLPADAEIEGYHPEGYSADAVRALRAMTQTEEADIAREIKRRLDEDYQRLTDKLRAEGKIL